MIPFDPGPIEYYIRTKGFCGNSLLWWRENGNGYTTDLNDAWRVSEEKAKEICNARPGEDFAYRADEMNAAATLQVSCESEGFRAAKPLPNRKLRKQK